MKSHPSRSAVSPLVVDSQVHIWLPQTGQRRWPSWGEEMRAGAHRPELRAESLLAEMADAGVDRAVLVPPFFEGYRNDYVRAAAAARPDRFRAMVRLSLRAPDLVSRLEALAADPLIAGVRLVFLPLDAGRVADARDSPLWSAAAERNVPIMLHCPGQLADVRRIARRHPRLRLAVDHLGLSGGHVDADVESEVRHLLELADEPGVCVKASALPCFSTEPFPHPALLEPVKSAIRAFGPERVFWGSDLSRLPGRYSDAVRMVREHLGLDQAEVDQVLGRSLLGWLGWAETR